jgi:uncharacterized repeat protein (TIGR01451 family)
VAEPAIQVVTEASAAAAKVGDTITYTHSVENIGDTVLANVIASDDRLGAISLGSTTLAAGETTTGTATSAVGAEDLPGPLTNTVTVTGTPPVGAEVVARDTVTVSVEAEPGPMTNTVYLPLIQNDYIGRPSDVEPAIEVSKIAEPTMVRSGDTVTFTIRVDNRGAESLTLIALEDSVFDDLTGECGLPAEMTIDHTFECVISRTISAYHTNTITATAEDSQGSRAADSAHASVDLIEPAIQVVVEASAAAAKVGDTITYTHSVENTGDAPLANVLASDDRLGAISLGSTTLAAGETTTGTASYAVGAEDLPGPLTNTVTVTGTPPVGADVVARGTVTVSVEAAPGAMTNTVHLPLIQNNYAGTTPASVEHDTVTGSSVHVVLENQGHAPLPADTRAGQTEADLRAHRSDRHAPLVCQVPAGIRRRDRPVGRGREPSC